MTLRGIIAPTTTPFTTAGDIELSKVKAQIDRLVAAGDGHAPEGAEYRDLIAAKV